jgi:hypothetical protein
MPMRRTQIYLTAEQHRELLRLAARHHTTMAGVLREAVATYLVCQDEDDDPLLDVIAIARGDVTDAAENHDRYLYTIDEGG